LLSEPTPIGARLIRGALTLARSEWNPAWRYGDIIRAELGAAGHVAVNPRQVLGKIGVRTMARLKRRFLVPRLANRDVIPIAELPTYRDIQDFDTHGEDYRATRLYRWLKRSADEGKPVKARGVICDTEERILSYYFTYLDLFLSVKQRGYSYRGDDEICFGVTADGGIVHMRRGTHRLAAAHLLGLPFITGFVTHVDPAWLDSIERLKSGGPISAIALSLRELQAEKAKAGQQRL
jgi:hypothetical protein